MNTRSDQTVRLLLDAGDDLHDALDGLASLYGVEGGYQKILDRWSELHSSIDERAGVGRPMAPARLPEIIPLEVATVTSDGEGGLNITATNGATWTWCPGDTDRRPVPGDVLAVQLPIAVGIWADGHKDANP